MHFTYKVTDNKGFPGMIGMTQLIYTLYTTTGPNNASGGSTYGSASAPLLDNAADYIAPVPTSSTFVAIDAPGFGTPANGNTFNAMTGSGSFTDYFMYKANGTNSVWVTLDQATWGWSGSATWNGVYGNKPDALNRAPLSHPVNGIGPITPPMRT